MAIAVQRPFAGADRPRSKTETHGAPVSLFPFAGFLRRALDARRQRELEEEAIRLLHQAGGRLNDSVEREIARRHLGA